MMLDQNNKRIRNNAALLDAPAAHASRMSRMAPISDRFAPCGMGGGHTKPALPISSFHGRGFQPHAAR